MFRAKKVTHDPEQSERICSRDEGKLLEQTQREALVEVGSISCSPSYISDWVRAYVCWQVEGGTDMELGGLYIRSAIVSFR